MPSCSKPKLPLGRIVSSCIDPVSQLERLQSRESAEPCQNNFASRQEACSPSLPAWWASGHKKRQKKKPQKFHNMQKKKKKRKSSGEMKRKQKNETDETRPRMSPSLHITLLENISRHCREVFSPTAHAITSTQTCSRCSRACVGAGGHWLRAALKEELMHSNAAYQDQLPKHVWTSLALD